MLDFRQVLLFFLAWLVVWLTTYLAFVSDASAQPRSEQPAFGATAEVAGASSGTATETLGRSVVTRRQLEERMPRSTPDALRYEAGVYVQQTSHAQASPYVRGMTGQQVVHLFDGVRLNNGLYRQGPNQYFFTVDTLTLSRLEVIRGSASVLYGSDALGGALLAFPVDPVIDPELEGIELHPTVYGRFASADWERFGRAELEARLGSRTAVLFGAGYRDVNLLESGGVVDHLDPNVRGMDAGGVTGRGLDAPWVPRFEEERDHPDDLSKWRTQLGTGFREATFDGRIVHRLARNVHAVAAAYGYRQYDAPRTDQCPPPEAPLSDCLRIDEQFRTLVYAGLRGDPGPKFREVDLTVSWQKHHERRVSDRRASSRTELSWNDDVDTLGIAFRASTGAHRWFQSMTGTVRYGFEGYTDYVASNAFREFTDVESTRELDRGQYVDDSSYMSVGAFGEAEAKPTEWLTARAGVRISGVGARAPPNRETESAAVHREFGAVVAGGGIAVHLDPRTHLLVNVDQGFRAPNLDDLTSRQQTGPGFQFENANLRPERTVTVEAGARVERKLFRIEGWAFATWLDDGIVRSFRSVADCPAETPSCPSARVRLQLVNASGMAHIFGGEAWGTLYLPQSFTLRASIAYAWGEGPNPNPSNEFFGERVPLSRVPPLNGTAELRWESPTLRIYAAGALRWALDQKRLAPNDRSDARIPLGGTPGYAVADVRAGWRFDNRLRVSLVFENALDAAYRVHGSSVNGAGRGVIASAEASF